jgi:uncharacterized repeat protein (TIGR03803 family)
MKLKIPAFAVALALATNLPAQTFSIIYNFDGYSRGNPSVDLVVSGSTLYGTAEYGGGPPGNGTIFKLNIDGSSFTMLERFSGNDGVNPSVGLALSSSTLYGGTAAGGTFGNGIVFSINTDGTDYKILGQLGVVWVIFGWFWARHRIKTSRGAGCELHSSRPPAAKGSLDSGSPWFIRSDLRQHAS